MVRDLFRRGSLGTLLVAATAVLCASCADHAKTRSGDAKGDAATTAKSNTESQPNQNPKNTGASIADTVQADVKPSVAQQVPTDPQETTAADKDAAPEGKKDVAKDPYAVPDGSPEELLKFIADLSGYRPDITSREQAMEHVGKQHKAIIAAADKILAARPEDTMRAEALRKKLQSSWFVANTVDLDSLPKFEELARTLAADKSPEVAGDATLYLLAIGVRGIEHDKPAEAKALIAQFTEALNKQPLDERLPGLALNVPSMLEQAGHTDLAREAAQQFIAALKQSKSEPLAPLVEQLEGTLKKLEMVGKPLDIEGTLVDGKKFDWSAYKGKVVLVDFWATWCGPCLEELPNVRKTYETYHDRGFDVVGISLDDDRATLEKFLADEKIPWPILFGTTAEASGWKHPMAVRYGIDGIPAAFLVDKEGNLVSMNARGESLPRMVADLLGAAPAAGEKTAAGDTASDKEKPAAMP